MKKFCDISRELHLAEKFQICQIRKMGSTRKLTHLISCIRELSWSSICLWKQFLIIQISHYKWFEYKLRIVLKLMGLSIKNKKHMSPSTQLSISYLSLFFQVPCDLSIFPWAWRWYARDVIRWIPYLLKDTFTEPWNSVPRSLWTLLGGPINLKWWSGILWFL